jgi:hypothetical protein
MATLLYDILRRSIRLVLGASIGGICVLPVRVGSPLLIIDDPETPGAHGWEFNIPLSIESSRDDTLVEAPLFDINYGIADNN